MSEFVSRGGESIGDRMQRKSEVATLPLPSTCFTLTQAFEKGTGSACEHSPESPTFRNSLNWFVISIYSSECTESARESDIQSVTSQQHNKISCSALMIPTCRSQLGLKFASHSFGWRSENPTEGRFGRSSSSDATVNRRCQAEIGPVL